MTTNGQRIIQGLKEAKAMTEQLFNHAEALRHAWYADTSDIEPLNTLSPDNQAKWIRQAQLAMGWIGVATEAGKIMAEHDFTFGRGETMND